MPLAGTLTEATVTVGSAVIVIVLVALALWLPSETAVVSVRFVVLLSAPW